MQKLLSTLIFLMLCLAGAAKADEWRSDDEAALLHRQLQLATWPADIVRAAERLLQASPSGAWAAQAQEERDLAAQTARLLNSTTVHLQRSAFTAADLPKTAQADLRRAALGDRDAALRLAQRYKRSEERPAADVYRYLGWLQLGAMQGDEEAAYELALFFRKAGQPSLAAIYETRAVSLGFSMPVALDNIRK